MADSIRHISGNPDAAGVKGHQVDTTETYTSSGAKPLVIKSGGSEVISIDKGGYLSNDHYKTVLPEEGGAGIYAALAALDTNGGGVLQLLEGTYDMGAGMTTSNYSNIIAIFSNRSSNSIMANGSRSWGMAPSPPLPALWTQ